MANVKNESNQNYDFLVEKIQSLEKRLTGIESLLRIEWIEKKDKEDTKSATTKEYTSAATESKIVEYGLAWLGCVIFLFGIIFLMTYVEGLGHLTTSKAVAYLATFALFAFSYLLRNSFPIVVNVLNICNPLLLFYITLKLHFFTENQLVLQKTTALFLLFVIIGFQFYNALKKNSEFLGTIGIFLCVSTAIISDSAYYTFPILTISALAAIILFYKKVWWRLTIFSLFMTYLTHLLWLFNNPEMGNEFKIVELAQHNILFLFSCGIIFALSIFITKEKLQSNGVLISISIWNALCFSIILLVNTLAFYQDNYSLIFSAIASFCLLFGVILKLNANRNFAPATYASFGSIALSISVYGYAGLPDAYLLLVLQSILVVSMALWFRSRIIVIANTFLFISILLIYLTASPSVDAINFAFAFAALGTARILNWQKNRLTLKTEAFRNTYLIVVFVMLLYGLSEAFPSQYVTLAWTCAAIGFFILSILLRRVKYRWMSILTIIVTACHLIFIDLAQMEIGYRVIAFLTFAVISVGVSLYYTKRIHK